jgi:[glutamine synthetase] adenylyltransferase / [glutamine synthetase]-adenylyl-L-tyrosine phosphorylase
MSSSTPSSLSPAAAEPTQSADAVDPRWQVALRHSRYLQNLLAARPELVSQLAADWQRPVSADDLHDFLRRAACEDEESLKRTLRQLRRLVMARLIVRDLCAQAPLSEITESMTLLADVTTNFAHDFLHARLAAQYGDPLCADGQPQRMLVIGMGKLGGRELNVSSDIDLIFVYPEEGKTGGGRLDAYEFFIRLGKRLIAALGEITGDGQVFRVDMRLRPNGDSGPLVISLDALENYLITQGREWERYAWIKARVMNPDSFAGNAVLGHLEGITRPFIFRRYLDFGAINAMRDLHAQIRREVARKDMAEHIKLGPGGIREIEFIAQVFQLIRGGRERALQIRPTLSVLQLLVDRRLISPEQHAELTAAYDFLRRLEHRLQYQDDAQTHRLPQQPGDQQLVAESMGFTDYDALLAALNPHRQNVARQFAGVFGEPEADEGNGDGSGVALWTDTLDEEAALAKLGALGFHAPADSLALLRSFRSGSRYLQLPSSNRDRLDALGPRLIEAAAATPAPDDTLARGVAFLEAICRRGAYLALLQQYPQALRKVAEIVGASSWAATYLTRHPIVLDELLDPRLMEVATDWAGFRSELDAALAAHAGDVERQMDLLREMHHAQVFRLLTQDLAGLLTVERLSDHLTELADILLAAVVRECWPLVRQRHRPDPQFAIIGYGKLGGKELGYASDLDLVFIYDDPESAAPEVYSRLGQRLTSWLSSQTPAGILFETDLRLRPNGDSGLLVPSLEAFRDYQLNKAWVWEHQALTRARFVAGDVALGERFEAIRREILTQPRDLAKLREEVVAMRHKMLSQLAVQDADQFDLKQDPGGIIDVEFIVQYLILGHAHQHPQLCGNLGNIALLKMAAEIGLIEMEEAEPVRAAYRHYRRLQHAKRLNDSPRSKVVRGELAAEIEAVRRLWRSVFGEG